MFLLFSFFKIAGIQNYQFIAVETVITIIIVIIIIVFRLMSITQTKEQGTEKNNNHWQHKNISHIDIDNNDALITTDTHKHMSIGN